MLKESFAAYRSDFIQTGISCHGRVPEMAAELRIGMKMFLWFLEDNKIITETDAQNKYNTPTVSNKIHIHAG